MIFEQLLPIVSEIFIDVRKQVSNKIRFVLLESNYWYWEGSVGQGEDNGGSSHSARRPRLGIRVEEIEDMLGGGGVELCRSKEKRHKMILRFLIE